MAKSKIEHFTFYRNYYDIYKYLNDEEKLKIIDSILEFMFEDKEPILEGLSLGIWNNIKMPLNTTKTNIINGSKGGRPKTQSKTKTKTETKTETKPKVKPKPKANNISIFLFLFSNINISNLNNKDNIYKLLTEYLELRIKNKYTVTETVVTRLINKLNEYGKTDKEKEEIIKDAINGAWKDFYPPKIKKEVLPDWFDKEIKEEKVDDKELKELIKKYE